MNLCKKIGLALRVRKGVKRGERIAKEMAEQEAKMLDTSLDSVAISKAKAKTAAGHTVKGAVASGGVIGGALVFIRQVKPDLLPWSQDMDPALIAILTAAGSAIWTWVQTFRKDQAKHNPQ